MNPMNPWFRARDFLRPVSRAPADVRDAWIHHGFRIVLVALIALSIPWLFPRTSVPELEGFEVGQVARHDVIARIPFSVAKSQDVLAAEQREAEASVPTMLAYRPARADSALLRARALFAALDSVVPLLERRAADEDLAPGQREAMVLAGIAEVANRFSIPYPTNEQLAVLAAARNRAQLRRMLERAFDGPLRAGVVSGVDLDEVTSGRQDAATRNVVIRGGGGDQLKPLRSIVTMESFLRSQVERAADELPPTANNLMHALLVLFARPTLELDRESMRLAREQARRAVQVASGYVLEGERIVTEHELIGEREYERLRAYQQALVDQNLAGRGTGFWRSLGMVLLAGSLVGILVFMTYSFRTEIYRDLRSFSVLLLLIMIVLAAAGVIARTGAPPALIPVALAALVVSALFDAFLSVVVVSAIAGILLGQAEFEGLAVPMLTAAGGVTAAFAVAEIRRRSQSWLLIALITAAYVGTAVCLFLIGRFEPRELAVTALAGFGNATVCTALAMGAVLPALEGFTRRTTEQTLLELADMNRPLLRRLAREAPGTYAHSINMANLVEAACSAIGADSLKARVGVYYHDVGKVLRPQYFIENQPRGLNPHDRLTPHQSAEILRAHVRDGLRLAEEARLPPVVRDFIREHHGTQKIQYFLARAMEQDPARPVDPNDFCYPGPKPQSKETAIAMLADAVESASRTLADPSPERIRGLIESLVTARVTDGQLDECGLTFRDLDRVKREFARVLTGLYHQRIDYPALASRADPASGASDAPAAVPGGWGSPVRIPAASGTPPGEGTEAMPGSEQMTIDLERAAQSDTGPPPALDRPASEPAVRPVAPGSTGGSTPRRD